MNIYISVKYSILHTPILKQASPKRRNNKNCETPRGVTQCKYLMPCKKTANIKIFL